MNPVFHIRLADIVAVLYHPLKNLQFVFGLPVFSLFQDHVSIAVECFVSQVIRHLAEGGSVTVKHRHLSYVHCDRGIEESLDPVINLLRPAGDMPVCLSVECQGCAKCGCKKSKCQSFHIVHFVFPRYVSFSFFQVVAEKIAARMLATMKIQNVALQPRLILSATAPISTLDRSASPMR